MNELIKYEPGQVKLDDNQIIQLSGVEFAVVQTLSTFNQLRSFKLSVIEALEWKDSLLKIIPDLEPGKLEFVIDRMLTEELDYDKTIGIQNIFRGLKQVEKTENGYKIKKGWLAP